MKPLDMLNMRLDALGDTITKAQADNLVEWIVETVPHHEWPAAAESVLMMGIADIKPGPNNYDLAFTDLTMRMGEMGI